MSIENLEPHQGQSEDAYARLARKLEYFAQLYVQLRHEIRYLLFALIIVYPELANVLAFSVERYIDVANAIFPLLFQQVDRPINVAQQLQETAKIVAIFFGLRVQSNIDSDAFENQDAQMLSIRQRLLLLIYYGKMGFLKF